MVEEYHGYAVFDKGSDLRPYSYIPKPLGDEDLEVEISHCGICAICILCTLVGAQLGTPCTTGYDQLCSKKVFTYNDMWKDAGGNPIGYQTQGGYADKIRTHSNFAFHIPEAIKSVEAGPLFCAGVSTFVPLKRHNVGPGYKVGVSGIGGLGHMAIQWAAKMGAEVTAISHSIEKRNDAIKLGATHFLDTSDPKEVEKFAQSQDIVFMTSFNPDINWSQYLGFVKNRGTLILLGLPEVPIQFSPFALMRFIKIEGSLIGGRQDIKDMLEFAAKHDVRPWVQRVPMKNINEGVQIVLDGKARYRMVLEN
ncbi:15403_t:CDS:2 [Acaulospora colombiana]|uniref:15403_t:CDS:1 n=1 Tax=Acaulospora colombiana TaxID=27376 RepID=A0ACA9MRD9_9GLOM|nr:15403_t:CDS:2 [Acaulospora colombiana]